MMGAYLRCVQIQAAPATGCVSLAHLRLSDPPPIVYLSRWGLGESHDASPGLRQESLKITPDNGRDTTLRKIHKVEMKTLAGSIFPTHSYFLPNLTKSKDKSIHAFKR